MDLPPNVLRQLQDGLALTINHFWWYQVDTPKGKMVMLVISSPSGLQAYLMPPVTAKEVSEGLAQMASPLVTAKQMPPGISEQDEAWLHRHDPGKGV